jgi:cell division protein FtsI (penicillin-binding protein 3)
VQVLQAEEWRERAASQQRERVPLPAERGTIYDRNGVPLATTREVLRVSVAPREIEAPMAVAAALREELGLGQRTVRRALDRSRPWVVLPGRYEVTVRRELERLRGVYLERVFERFHPHGSLGLELLGRVSADGTPRSGLELEADSLLAGEDGYAVRRRDARGEPIPGPPVPARTPRPGLDLYLTLDLGLQEIVEEALRETIETEGAAGGDMIFADPRTGDILAAVSIRRAGGSHWRGVTDPYEPGSTMKPFVMAALLETGLATLGDTVFAEEGYYRTGRREIRDVHGYGWLTAGEVLRYSSNIGMVKLAERLPPEVEYAVFRDFGFGTPTGIQYPSESGGRLSRPDAWSKYSAASLAMGYEISVTPLQMTMAYGALANGGRLMTPRLIREVRRPDGTVVARTGVRTVRDAVSPQTARSVAAALADVVQEGTGRRAGLGEFTVAGKTGTARAFEDGGYRSDLYTASFAGFFPVREPQLVFLVKLDRGSDYGGSVAAPVTRATLAAALAARATPLDRGAVATAIPDPPLRATATATPWLPAPPGPYHFRPGGPSPRPVMATDRSVPDVRGENARDAAATLHAAGFRVRVEGAGWVRSMRPVPGDTARSGAVVHLVLGSAR